MTQAVCWHAEKQDHVPVFKQARGHVGGRSLRMVSRQGSTCFLSPQDLMQRPDSSRMESRLVVHFFLSIFTWYYCVSLATYSDLKISTSFFFFDLLARHMHGNTLPSPRVFSHPRCTCNHLRMAHTQASSHQIFRENGTISVSSVWTPALTCNTQDPPERQFTRTSEE